MPLTSIDKIVQLEKGVRIRAEKRIHPDEEHYKDHFGNFPVLPGVLMLEGLSQAASYLVRDLEDFAHSQVFMTSCSQAKFSKLVQPPAVVTFDVELIGQDAGEFEFKGKVSEGERGVAVARFKMKATRILDHDARSGHLEEALVCKQRLLFADLCSH